MPFLRKIFLFLLIATCNSPVFSQQIQFSLSTDFSVLRSFKKEQQYWAVGQTVSGYLHFSPKNSLYVWLTYYSNGKFDNVHSATAKSPLTVPQQQIYNNTGRLRYRHISVGWKHYLKSSYSAEDTWGIYAYAGMGLMFGSINNTHSLAIDTADYLLPVLPGKGNFKRLTLDLGLGYEIPVGGDLYFYLEGRALIPTTDYPSNYLFINKYAPFTAAANLGLRILFD